MYNVRPLRQLDARREVSYRHPMSAVQIFSEVVDILGRPNKFFYKQLAKFAVDPKEKTELETIVSDTPAGQKKYAELAKVRFYC